MQYYSKAGPKGNNRDLYLRQQLQEHMMQVEKKQRLQSEALANLGEQAGIAA
jgi:hypothetical protein